MKWKGLWLVTRIWDISSASFEGSSFGRLRENPAAAAAVVERRRRRGKAGCEIFCFSIFLQCSVLL